MFNVHDAAKGRESGGGAKIRQRERESNLIFLVTGFTSVARSASRFA